MTEIWAYVLQSLIWSFGGFVGGFYAAKLKFDVDEIKEAAVPDKDESTRDPTHRREERLAVPRWVGILIILLSLFTVGQAWYFAARDRDVSECQSRTNQEFQAALAARNTIADEDRRVLDKLVTDITRSTSPEQSRKALETYVAARAANDAKRAKNPLPGISNCEDLRR
jgi:hypothetical protein